jgi:hypothetical protein
MSLDKTTYTFSGSYSHEGPEETWQAFDYEIIKGLSWDKPYKQASATGTWATAVEPTRLISNISSGSAEYLKVDPSSSHKECLVGDSWITDMDKKIIIRKSQYHPGLYSNSVQKFTVNIPTWTYDDNYDEAFKRIGRFATLDATWDSYGSSPIDKDCIINAINLLKQIVNLRKEENISVPAPFVAPISTGGIQFEWEINLRYLELSLTPGTEEISYFAVEEDECNIKSEGILPYKEWLIKLLYWITGIRAINIDEINEYLLRAA